MDFESRKNRGLGVYSGGSHQSG